MAMVAMGASLLGGVFGAMGAMEQGQAQSNMMTYQAQVAQANATIASQQAAYETKKGEVAAQEQGIKTKANVGAIVAQQGAGNLDVGSGSAADVSASAEKLGVYNESLARADAARKAYNYQVAAFGSSAQAGLDQFGAQQAITGSYFTAAGDLIGAGGSVAGKWYQYSGGSSGGAPSAFT